MERMRQRQRKPVVRDPVKRMLSRRDTEKDARSRQTERWRQKVRRQKQMTERQTERKIEVTEREMEGDEREGEGGNERTGGLRRGTRERRMKISWCIWCGIGCRGEEGGRCKEKRQRRDRRRLRLDDKEVQGPPKGSGDNQRTKTSTLGPPKEVGKKVEVVGESVSLSTQTKSLCGDKSVFRGGGTGGEESQPKEDRGKEIRSTEQTGEEGGREDTEGREREETGMSKVTEDSGDNNLENS